MSKAAPRDAGFDSYIPASTMLRELTLGPLIVGTILGMVFGASSLYLVLKVGLTVSASIPVAVISITLFRLWSKMGGRDATILENNIVQTAGSAGESIAFGIGVTMPAIMILGFDLEATRVLLVAVLGGLLGILMMIPLRRALIVQQHGLLKYPEGTACAEVLKAGASPESIAAASPSAKAEMEKLGGQATSAKTIFSGFGSASPTRRSTSSCAAGRTRPRRSSARPSTPARSRPRSRPSCSASATSSARASPRSCAPAECSPTSCSSRRSSSSARGWPSRWRPRRRA
jgi:uncharacterized oligopeptide transporter (OPT) family protein